MFTLHDALIVGYDECKFIWKFKTINVGIVLIIKVV